MSKNADEYVAKIKRVQHTAAEQRVREAERLGALYDELMCIDFDSLREQAEGVGCSRSLVDLRNAIRGLEMQVLALAKEFEI